MSENDFGSFLQVLLNVFNNVIGWLDDIEIAGISLWSWLLGFWGVSLIIICVRMFSGLSGPGLSTGINSVVEASRSRPSKEVHVTDKARNVSGDAHRVRWNDVAHEANRE